MLQTGRQHEEEKSLLFDRDFTRRLAEGDLPLTLAPFQAARPSAAEAASFRRWANRHNHSHPFFEVLVAVRGTCAYGVEEQIFVCQPGTVVLLRPHEVHANRYRAQDDGLRHIWLSFITPEQGILQLVEVQRGRLQRLHLGRSLMPVGSLYHLLQTLDTADSSASPAARARRHLLEASFQTELLLSLLDAGQPEDGALDRDALVSQKIAMLCEYIEREQCFATTVAELAMVAGYTPGHLARLFKKSTGHTIHQFIEACRVRKARQLLAQRQPLKVMASQLGFADKTTVCRWLNKMRRAISD